MKGLIKNKHVQALAVIAAILILYFSYRDFYTGAFNFYDQNGVYHEWTKVSGSYDGTGNIHDYELKFSSDNQRDYAEVTVRVNEYGEVSLLTGPRVQFGGKSYSSRYGINKNRYEVGDYETNTKGIYHDDSMKLSFLNCPLRSNYMSYSNAVTIHVDRFEFKRNNYILILAVILGIFALDRIVRQKAKR